MRKLDQIYKMPLKLIKPFAFNHDVAMVFDDMVTRSVPLYQESQRMIIELLGKNLNVHETVYDIGSSTGTSLLNLNSHLHHLNLNLVGIEASEDMVKLANEKCSSFLGRIKFYHQDVEEFNPTKNAAVISHYTLQFIAREKRLPIIKKFQKQMRPGGIFILSEKIKSDSLQVNKLMIDCYHDYKKRKGYSELEINQKAKALEGVLVPQTIQENVEMLKNAGFETVEIALRWYNFVTFIAFNK